jgi:hypothetical protein
LLIGQLLLVVNHEFVTDGTDGLKSSQLLLGNNKWGKQEFNKPKTFDIWSFLEKEVLFNRGIYFMDELTEDTLAWFARGG